MNAIPYQRSALSLLAAVSFTLLSACKEKTAAPAAESAPEPAASAAPALPPPNPEKNAYFGDLHLHTQMSFDAYTMKTNTLPEDSYRYARGETVDYLGQPVKRKAPLDFLAVTDHSEYLGVFRQAGDPNGPFKDTDWPKKLNPDQSTLKLSSVTDSSKKDASQDEHLKLILQIAAAFGGGKAIDEFRTPELLRSNWQRQIDAAEKYYTPGKFTTFVAYEWTAMINFDNLHRNVIFRGPKYPEQPFSSIDSFKPEDLWAYADKSRENGVDLLLIPHNSNVSNGRMFDVNGSSGKPIDKAYAQARSRNERLVEVTQAKGTSDTRPELSPNDEFADFELLKMTSFSGAFKPENFAGSYVRSAYKRGLEIESRVGANPYDFGLVGASDFHSGVSSTEEGNFPGAHGLGDSHQNAKAVLADAAALTGLGSAVLSAGALTGVWAEQNTRESIFDALKRREVFGTSGNRVQVRLFAGWKYAPDLVKSADWLKTAYADGVPMGADLPPAEAGAPRFLLQAAKDPDGGNLDRIQIIKLWFKDGKAQEKVFDAVWSGERKPDPKTGKLPDVGDTVDAKTATYRNDIGSPTLLGQWSDPEFDAKSPALYYARVLEIPTPRWTTYLSAQSGIPVPKGVPVSIRERAWTSPVFYRPGA